MSNNPASSTIAKAIMEIRNAVAEIKKESALIAEIKRDSELIAELKQEILELKSRFDNQFAPVVTRHDIEEIERHVAEGNGKEY